MDQYQKLTGTNGGEQQTPVTDNAVPSLCVFAILRRVKSTPFNVCDADITLAEEVSRLRDSRGQAPSTLAPSHAFQVLWMMEMAHHVQQQEYYQIAAACKSQNCGKDSQSGA